MFTGIVAGRLAVKSVQPLSGGKQMALILPAANTLLNTGDSIALNGVCTTAIDISESGFSIQLLAETLQKTTLGSVKPGDALNWELSATPATALGGHLVYGHVDETAIIQRIQQSSPWTVVTIHFSPKFRPYLVEKGSVCIDGTSLTVVDIQSETFSVHLIPHTFKNTVLHEKKAGDTVNIEYDIIAKYLYNFTTVSNRDAYLFHTLNKAGFV